MCRRSCRDTFYVLLFKDFSGHSAFSLIFHVFSTTGNLVNCVPGFPGCVVTLHWAAMIEQCRE